MLEKILNQGIRITQDAFDKANHIAQRVKVLSGQPLECYMWFLGDDIIRDVMVVDSQHVTPVFCEINGYGKDISQWRISKSNYNIVGWCHSHGDLPAFFSSQDYKNARSEIDRCKNDYTYFMTVNAHNDVPFCAIGNNKYYVQECPLTIKKSTHPISFDVDDEILDKVNYQGITLRQRTQGMMYSSDYKEQLVQFKKEWKRTQKSDESVLEQLLVQGDEELAHKTQAISEEKHTNYTQGLSQFKEQYQHYDYERLNTATDILLGRYGWRWDTRLKELQKLYENGADLFEFMELQKLKTVVISNKYAMRLYGSSILKLFTELYNNDTTIQQAATSVGPQESKED